MYGSPDYLHKSRTMNMCRKQIPVTSDSVLMLPRLYLQHVPALQEKVVAKLYLYMYVGKVDVFGFYKYMYVCARVCVCICVCLYVCVCVCVCVCTLLLPRLYLQHVPTLQEKVGVSGSHAYMGVLGSYMYIYVCARVYTYIFVCACVHVGVCVCVCVCVCV